MHCIKLYITHIHNTYAYASTCVFTHIYTHTRTLLGESLADLYILCNVLIKL